MLSGITPCFSPLKIYIPWGGTVPEYVNDEDITASYPPEEYKPEADFNALLDECFNWAYEQGEKSRKEIIKTGHINPTSNESLRHIKTTLANRISDTSQKDMILRWHMLLHLANRLEENRNDANRMLENLKKQPSPLMNNADLTESTQYPLESLRAIAPESFLNDTNMKQLLRAWYGLFSGMIDRDDMLLIIDRRIFDCLSDECNILGNNLKNPEIVSFKSPLFEAADIRDKKITIADNICDVMSSDLKQEDRITALKKLTAGFESEFQSASMDRYIHYSMFFSRPSEPDQKDSFIDFFSGRAIILAEIDA